MYASAGDDPTFAPTADGDDHTGSPGAARAEAEVQSTSTAVTSAHRDISSASPSHMPRSDPVTYASSIRDRNRRISRARRGMSCLA